MYMYSTLLLILMACPIVPCLILYARKKEKIYIHFAGLFLCYFFELGLIHYIGFFFRTKNKIAATVDDLLRLEYHLAICIIILILDFLILAEILNIKIKPWHIVFILPYICTDIWLLTLPKTAFNIWLFFSLRQFYRFAYIIWFYVSYTKEKDALQKARLKKFTLPITGILFLNLAILLEDTLTTSQLNSLLIKASYNAERNFSENILWLFIGICVIIETYRELNSEFKKPKELSIANEDVIQNFALQYGLTARETDLLKLMAEQKNIETICNELHISKGTVKTHAHNIYKKTHVNNRNELMIMIGENFYV